jgi:dienelactone hydrolase
MPVACLRIDRQEPMPRPLRLLLVLGLGLAGTVSAAADLLQPYKDRLFSYPAVLATSDGGARRVVDYRELRDINDRDEIPERRVRSDYVSLGVRRMQRELVLKTHAGALHYFAIGNENSPRFIVVYLHGQGGNRRQGIDDFTFGGNFNRIKNLVARNGGLYLSPDVPDFGEAGAEAVAALLAHYRRDEPDRPVIVACGSMGGALCWQLSRRPPSQTGLAGLILLGSMWDEGFLDSRAFSSGVPVYFGHGSRDTVFPVERQEAFFRSILARAPGYPVRFVRFETGTHGTPIRMIDWRETLNWMLTQARKKQERQ